MSRLFFIVLAFSGMGGLFAQVPQAFSYQAIVLDADGDPVTDQMVGVEISILDASITGPTLYTETHSIQTNMNGVYSISIGLGTPVEGTFSDIDWGGDAKFLSISQDITGGSNYTFVGASQLLSVPYALVAGNADVSPKVYAYAVTGREDNFLINADPTTSLNFFINYEWIQGEPEDVFVEFNNLPANTNLHVKFESGTSGFEPFDNLSAVDTIYDGLRIRNLELVKTDPNVDMIPGDYVIEIVYRTASSILTSIEYPITVYDTDPDDPGENPNCLNNFAPSTHVLAENSCPELEDILLDEIEITVPEFNPDFIEFQLFAPEASTVTIFVDVFNNGECFYEVSEFYFEDGSTIYEGFIDNIEVDEAQIQFFVTLNILEGQDPYPQPLDCIITYLR